MSLPHKEWREYLDKLLDTYMRTNITIDHLEYMVDTMEQIFAEHLNEVSEYAPNSAYPLVLDPLDVLFARPEIRAVVSAFNPNTMGLEEKWVVKREIMTYIKEVVDLTSNKARRNKQPSRPLPSVACWLKDGAYFAYLIGYPITAYLFLDDFKPWEAYMEPALLTRAARTQTPLQGQPTSSMRPKQSLVSRIGQNSISALPSNKPSVPGRANKRRKTDHSRPSTRSTLANLGTQLHSVPLQDETITEKEAESMFSEKLPISHAVKGEMIRSLRATPFSMSMERASASSRPLRSETSMWDVKDEEVEFVMEKKRPMSPPIFSSRHKGGTRSANAVPAGIETLKKVMPFVARIEPEEEEREDMMEMMRIAEGWPTAPLDLWSSPKTPSLTADASKDVDMEDEDMIQIDELMQPSSPAYKNRELKELFGKRMDEILLPRGTYPFQGRGGTDSKILPMASSNKSFSVIMKQTLQVPTKESPLESIGLSNTNGVEAGQELDEMLDVVFHGAKETDKYSLITKERLEDDQGNFLPVPVLAAPTEGINPAIPKSFSQLSMPQDVLCLRDTFDALKIPYNQNAPLVLLRPAGGVAGLLLELTWQPFVYRGPIITHDTLCEVHNNPFRLPDLRPSSLNETKSDVDLLLRARELLEKHDSRTFKEPRSSMLMRIGGYEEETVWTVPSYNWSNDEVILLTRAEKEMAHRLEHAQGPDGMEGDELSGAGAHVGISHPNDINNVDISAPTFAGSLELQDEEMDNEPSAYDHVPSGVEDHAASGQWQHDANLPVTDGFSIHDEDPLEYQEPDMVSFGLTSIAPIHSFQPLDLGIEDDQILEAPDSPLNPNNPLYPSSHSSFPLAQQPPPFSTVGLLQEFLNHRGETTHGYSVNQLGSTISSPRPSNDLEDSSSVTRISSESSPSRPVFPPDLLSERIFLPPQWPVPIERHRYLASLAFVQRRALVKALAQDCSVDLTELEELNGADLIIDSHTAVKLVTVSEVVPSNLDSLASEIISMGYGFSRIMLVLENYPFSRGFLVRKLEENEWAELDMVTATVISTCSKLRRRIAVGMGLLEGERNEDGNEGLGTVEVEIVLASSPRETARLVRRLGDYVQVWAANEERNSLWGPRLWLEDSPWSDVAIALGRCRGMNVFATLAIFSVESPSTFEAMSQLERLRLYGGLIGGPRMRLFEEYF